MSAEQTSGQKAATVALWIVTVAVAVGMTLAGQSKFTASAMWITQFTGWSLPIWFMYVIGAVEVVGALALLVPRFTTYAAGVLALIMAGALFTLLTNPGDMGPVPPLVNLILLVVIGFMRRNRRWKPS